MGAMLWKLGTVLIGSPWMARLMGELPAVGASRNKGLIHSETAGGALLVLLPYLFHWLGWKVPFADVQAIVDSTMQIVGALLAIHGRITASRKIG